MTNISLMSQRDDQKKRVSSSLFGIMSNFNDTFSMGSLLSGQPDQSHHGLVQRSSLENEMLSTSKSRGPTLLVDEQKNNISIDLPGGGVVPRATANESVLEQTIEEDKDEEVPKRGRRNSSTLIIESQRHREQA